MARSSTWVTIRFSTSDPFFEFEYYSIVTADLGSTLAGFTSAFPAVALVFGFLLLLIGTTDGPRELVQAGWGFITVGVIVEFVLPISRRLR